MPKILFVTTNFETGAIPNILLDLAPHLVVRGWTPHFLALEPLPEHASVRRCRELGYPLETLGVSSRAVWGALSGLRKAIRRISPDLIHTHLGRADVYVPWVKGRVPVVSTFHSVRQNSGRLTQWGWRVTDTKVAFRTGVSQACIDSFYPGVLSSKHSVVYNPVDPDRLKATSDRAAVLTRLGLPDESRILLAVGRLVPLKGHASLIRAFAALLPGTPELKLVLAGDGPARAELQALAADLGLGDRCCFAGAWDGVADLYRCAEILVFPSYWEGLGLVPLEALACGCPVASSRLPAVAEFLDDGVTGRFFEAGNPDDMARVLAQMLRDPQLSRQQAVRGQAMVAERFAPPAIAAQYDAVYRSVWHG